MAEGRDAMAPDELKARARRLPDELLTQGDLAVADELLAPDFTCHAPGTLAHGVAGAKRWVAGHCQVGSWRVRRAILAA